ncbi:hypothetical protein JST99_01045 [Candidatus Dependentiae bacterium]|nr:hypothetical protein [Candidatus Dependentiae bacterium]MCC7414788.1 hypothetical protein [Campylobacterota bacterium]
MENKCLLAVMLFYAGLCVCANTEDFNNAYQEIQAQIAQEEMVAAVRQLLPVHNAEHILTDTQIRETLNRVQQTMTPAHIPARMLEEAENDMRLDLAQHYPGHNFGTEEIREIALRGLQTQAAVRLLSSQDHN